MRRPSLGDVRVTGLIQPKHVIADINMNVPYGMTVTVPADLAARSKDLWLGISQHRLLQLGAAAPAPKFLPPIAGGNQINPQEKSRFEAQIRELEAQNLNLKVENQSLKTENQSLRASLAKVSEAQNSKFDTLLEAIKGINVVAAPAAGAGYTPPTAAPKREIADGEAPTFLPSQIRPEKADVRIDVQGESAESSVSSAAEKLRKLRKGS